MIHTILIAGVPVALAVALPVWLLARARPRARRAPTWLGRINGSPYAEGTGRTESGTALKMPGQG